MPPHVHIDFLVPPPGCGQCVTDLWDWSTHRTQLRCPDYVSDDMYERGVPKLYRLPRPLSLWGSSPARENSYGRTGNRTGDLIFRGSSGDQGMRQVSILNLNNPTALSTRCFSGNYERGRCVYFVFTVHCCKRFRNNVRLHIYIYIHSIIYIVYYYGMCVSP
jgi:hypothetical protein